MAKRVTFMFATIVAALGIGLGIAVFDLSPAVQMALAAIGGLALWGISIAMERDGDIWRFGPPYP